MRHLLVSWPGNKSNRLGEAPGRKCIHGENLSSRGLCVVLEFSLQLLIFFGIIGLSGNGNHLIVSTARRRGGRVGLGPGDYAVAWRR